MFAFNFTKQGTRDAIENIFVTTYNNKIYEFLSETKVS